VNRARERVPYAHHYAHGIHTIGYGSYKTVGMTLRRVDAALEVKLTHTHIPLFRLIDPTGLTRSP
jgi:hypothetical protein